MNTVSTTTVSNLVIDLEALASRVQDIVGIDKINAYDRYTELREQARITIKIANVYGTDAIWLRDLVTLQFEELKKLESVKKALTLAFASGTQEEAHAKIRAEIERTIIAADPRLQEAADERPDKTVSAIIYFEETEKSLKAEADLMFKEADALLKAHGLNGIVENKAKVGKAINKK